MPVSHAHLCGSNALCMVGQSVLDQQLNPLGSSQPALEQFELAALARQQLHGV